MGTPILTRKLLKHVLITNTDKNLKALLKVDGTPLDEFINNITEFKDKCEGLGYTNITLTTSLKRTYAEIEAYGDRQESDVELAARQQRADGISKEKERKANIKLQEDLAVLARLQQEYGEELAEL